MYKLCYPNEHADWNVNISAIFVIVWLSTTLIYAAGCIKKYDDANYLMLCQHKKFWNTIENCNEYGCLEFN